MGMGMQQVVGSHALRTMLGAVGAMALLLLAIPLLIAVVLLGLFATVAFVGVLFKLAPALLIGLLLYWVLSGRARAPRLGHGYREI